MTKEELEIAKAACCVATMWDQYEGTEHFDKMVGLRVQHLIKLVRNYQQPSLPSNLDEAALKELQVYLPQGNGPDGICYFIGPQMLAMFKAGAELMAGQFVLVGGEPTGWFMTNDGSEYATGLDLKEPIKLPVDFYVKKK